MHRTGRRAGHGVEFFYDAILTAPSGRFRICRRTTDQPLHHADVPTVKLHKKALACLSQRRMSAGQCFHRRFFQNTRCVELRRQHPVPSHMRNRRVRLEVAQIISPAGNKNLRRRVLRCRPVANFQRIQVTTASRIDSIPKPRLPDHHVFGSRRSLVDLSLIHI